MIASSVVLIGPSLARIFIFWLHIAPDISIWYGGFLSIDLTLLTLLVVDIINHKRNYTYAFALAVSLPIHIAWLAGFPVHIYLANICCHIISQLSIGNFI
jgi:hypothetical protein